MSCSSSSVRVPKSVSISSRNSSTIDDASEINARTNTRTEARYSSKAVSVKGAGGDGQQKGKIEDQMNNENLEMLQKIFEEADEDCGGGLDIEEFRQAMKMAFGSADEIDDKQLELMFMKVDTNCDGTVDWEEFCSYMLLENQQKDSMSRELVELPFPHPAREVHNPHHDSLTKLTYFSSLSMGQRSVDGHDEDVSDNGNGRYVSCSKDGVFVFWGNDLQLQRTVHLNELTSGVKSKPLWVTDVVCLANVKKIAVSTTERDITFYDCSANNFEKQFVVTGLEHCVLCMDYWYNPSNLNESCLIFGDAGGSVSCITFTLATVGLFDVTLGKHKNMSTSTVRKISFLDLFAGRHANVNAVMFKHLHGDWVRKVKYIPSLQCFISCANTSQTSLFLGDLQRKKMMSFFKIRKGVYTFDYDKENNFIVTGGLDRYLRLWNPYVNSKATSLLKGHNSSVVHVLAHGDQIISMSKDKIIKVWNTRDHCCIQTIPSRLTDFGGTHPITTVFYNKKTHTMLLGSNTIAVFERKLRILDAPAERRTPDDDVTSHPKPLCGALYNDLFDQVVSACHGSVVNVWHLETGEKAIMFANAHNGHEITAMSFDPTKRRLITGSRNGTVKIWNFNNGAALREFHSLDDAEVTGIVCPKQRIVTVGWNHSITVYRDVKGAEDDPPKLWNHFHKDDILAVDLLKSGVMATASYDGHVMCWNVESGHNYCHINVNNVCKNKPTPLEPTFPVFSNAKPTSECHKHSVDKIMFLSARKFHKETATLLISVEGSIQAWNMQGGLLGQWNAVGNEDDESVLAMVSDKQNHVVFTGDSLGYIRLWDISNYYIKADAVSNRCSSPLDAFEQKRKQSQIRRPSKVISIEECVTAPLCLVYYRAHTQGIVSLDYIEHKELLVSASTDCCARLFTINGKYVGTFGQKPLWDPLSAPPSATRKSRKLPTDLRVMSKNSLNVLGGSAPNWKYTKNVFTVLTLGKRKRSSVDKKTSAFLEQELIDDETALKSRSKLLNISLNNVLGKNYKPKQRHRIPPCVKPTFNHLQCVAFSSLPINELDVLQETKMPQVLKQALVARQVHNKAGSQTDTQQHASRNRFARKGGISPMKTFTAAKILPAIAAIRK